MTPDGRASRTAGSLFHEHSWHWAIHGDRYATDHPEPAEPSPEYLALG
ncbi:MULTISPECIES: hypothetical protein [unclassified Streptomyces]